MDRILRDSLLADGPIDAALRVLGVPNRTVRSLDKSTSRTLS
jgi:hypothetical protein